MCSFQVLPAWGLHASQQVFYLKSDANSSDANSFYPQANIKFFRAISEFVQANNLPSNCRHYCKPRVSPLSTIVVPPLWAARLGKQQICAKAGQSPLHHCGRLLSSWQQAGSLETFCRLEDVNKDSAPNFYSYKMRRYMSTDISIISLWNDWLKTPSLMTQNSKYLILLAQYFLAVSSIACNVFFLFGCSILALSSSLIV